MFDRIGALIEKRSSNLDEIRTDTASDRSRGESASGVAFARTANISLAFGLAYTVTRVVVDAPP